MDIERLTDLFYVANVANKILQRAEETPHYEVDPTIEPYLRPSGMPICPVLLVTDLMDRPGWREMNMGMDFYVTIGTAVHSWAQRSAARSGKLLGHWNCQYCTNLVDNKDATDEMRAEAVAAGTRKEMTTECTCDVCEYPMVYEELTVEYRGCKGHVDTLLVDMLPNGWVHLADYKTTSLRMKDYKERNHAIDPKYIVQLCCYAFILREVYKIRIGCISLMYQARDNYQQRLEFCLDWTRDIHEETREFIDSQIDAFAAAKWVSEQPFPEDHAEYLLSCKTCRDKVHYKQFMDQIFHYDGGCPYKDDCFTSRFPEILRKEIRRVRLALAGEENDQTL